MGEKIGRVIDAAWIASAFAGNESTPHYPVFWEDLRATVAALERVTRERDEARTQLARATEHLDEFADLGLVDGIDAMRKRIGEVRQERQAEVERLRSEVEYDKSASRERYAELLKERDEWKDRYESDHRQAELARELRAERNDAMQESAALRKKLLQKERTLAIVSKGCDGIRILVYPDPAGGDGVTFVNDAANRLEEEVERLREQVERESASAIEAIAENQRLSRLVADLDKQEREAQRNADEWCEEAKRMMKVSADVRADNERLREVLEALLPYVMAIPYDATERARGAAIEAKARAALAGKDGG